MSGLYSETPKARELHNKNDNCCRPNGPGEPSLPGRLFVKKPSEQFWDHCEAITLDVIRPIAIGDDERQLRKADFDGQERIVTVISNGDASLDPPMLKAPGTDVEEEVVVKGQKTTVKGDAVKWDAWEKIEPEKTVVPFFVSCGVKLAGGKQLARGDVVRLDTYAFDIVLDRMTRNDSGARIGPAPRAPKLTSEDVALAFAGAHRYYDVVGPARTNKDFVIATRLKPYGDFIAAMVAAGEVATTTTGEWAEAGVAFIQKHLETHGVELHEVTSRMIQEYLLTTLDKGRSAGVKETKKPNGDVRKVSYGFDSQWGVPGTHAEVLAVNEVVKALAKAGAVTYEDRGEITVATYKLTAKERQGVRQGRRFLACANCAGVLLPNVRVITE